MHGLPCFDLLAASIRKSGLEIENRCMDCPCFDLMAASIRKSGPEIRNRCNTIDAASRTVPPAEGRCRYNAASDSNLRRRKVEWPACSIVVVGRRRGQDATKAA